MTGLIIRFLQRFLPVNFLIFFAILIVSYVKNVGLTAQQPILYWIIRYTNYIETFVINDSYFNLYISILAVINSYMIFWAIKNYRYLNLPYAMGIYNQVKQFEGHEKRTKVHFDKFIKKKCYGQDRFSLYFKNWVSVEPKKYNDVKEDIAQYLGWNGDIKIYNYKTRGVELFFYKLPNIYHSSILMYKANQISFGRSLKGDYIIPFNELTHMIVVGESGSGKSNVMHHLLSSFISSKNEIEEIELIDLKGTELFIYHGIEYMHFIDEIVHVRDTLLTVRDKMKERFEHMKSEGEQLFSGKYHFIVIDEIGTLGTYPDKKLRDEIFNLMIEIAQKGRAAKILLFIFAQKIDSTNIPSNVLANLQTRVLMKTDSDFNINNTIGKKEDLENITVLNPDSFPRGRAIIKNGFTSEKVLVQFPLIELKKEYRDMLAK